MPFFSSVFDSLMCHDLIAHFVGCYTCHLWLVLWFKTWPTSAVMESAMNLLPPSRFGFTLTFDPREPVRVERMLAVLGFTNLSIDPNKVLWPIKVPVSRDTDPMEGRICPGSLVQTSRARTPFWTILPSLQTGFSRQPRCLQRHWWLDIHRHSGPTNGDDQHPLHALVTSSRT